MTEGAEHHPAHPAAPDSAITSEKPMSEGTEHHIEQAEHAQHAAHHPFDKRVAMTMAIVAAALAAVTLLSHRAHADFLAKKTEESDQWSYYQSKKNRGYMYEADAALVKALSKDAPESDAGKKVAEQEAEWKKKAEKYEKDADKIQDEANHIKHEGHVAHQSGNFFDLGELGIELALILCSIAVLTKRKPFWIAGILIGLVGLAVASGGFFVESLQPLLERIGLG